MDATVTMATEEFPSPPLSTQTCRPRELEVPPETSTTASDQHQAPPGLLDHLDLAPPPGVQLAPWVAPVGTVVAEMTTAWESLGGTSEDMDTVISAVGSVFLR